jgi:hypothetical protein
MVVYLFTNIDCASLCDFSLGCWNCSDTVVFYLFSLLHYIDQTSRTLYIIVLGKYNARTLYIIVLGKYML